MSADQLHTLLSNAFPGDTVHITGEACQLSVTVISASFAGQNTLARHRRVYAALGDLMQEAIHALSIKTLTPDELTGEQP